MFTITITPCFVYIFSSYHLLLYGLFVFILSIIRYHSHILRVDTFLPHNTRQLNSFNKKFPIRSSAPRHYLLYRNLQKKNAQLIDWL